MHVRPPYPIAIAKANTQLSEENMNRRYYSSDKSSLHNHFSRFIFVNAQIVISRKRHFQSPKLNSENTF